MKKIIIFGATGDVGKYLVDDCIQYFKDQYEIVAVGTRQTSLFEKYHIKYIRVDISDENAFSKLPVDDVHAVVHLAGLLPAYMKEYSPLRYIDVNLKGTLNILEYCQKNNVDRILYSQSYSDLAGYMNEGPVLEPYMPRKLKYTGDHAVYSITKCAAVDLIEHYHQEYHLKNFIFRLPNIYMYMPNEYYCVDGVPRKIAYRYMINRALKGLPIELWGDPEKSKDIVYVKDLCQMFCKATDTQSVNSGVYNVGTGVRTNMLQQIDGIIKVFSPKDNPSEIVYCPDKPDCVDFVMDIGNAETELGYTPQYDYISYLEDYKKEMLLNRFV